MKVPHALDLHGAQVLPVLAWLLLFANWSESRRTRTMIAGTLGYSGLVAVSALQAYSGRAPLDLGPAGAVTLGISAVLVVGAYAAALSGSTNRPA